MNSERELFKQAYMNLRSRDRIPFPDDVFDEYIRLRDSEGYKLVPVEPTKEMISAGMGVFSFPLDNGRFSDCELIFSYREMIGAVNE